VSCRACRFFFRSPTAARRYSHSPGEVSTRATSTQLAKIIAALAKKW
jgi:hypothetical protein